MTRIKENIVKSFDVLSSACNTLKNDKNFLDKYQSWLKFFLNTIDAGGTIFICGNGGSFAHAQHLTTELIVRFKYNREPIKAICLGSNQANLTAIGNDLEFDQIFSRELSGLYKTIDTVLILSTSGNSPSVIKVAEFVRSKGENAISILGKDGGKLKNISNSFVVPSNETSLIQEIQILIGHALCNELEQYILKKLNYNK
ncbi:SIS domain-containing protein [Prochlorococcus sp. AH-716-O10]|nr:SIS domain-containing protein [Prochlorococcus sp. AH-716-O10]